MSEKMYYYREDSSSSTSDDALHIVIDPPLDDVEHVSAAGENTPGSEGEKDVMETDEGAQSKYEPWLRVGQEQEVQMQERPPLLPQPPPRQYQTPPLPPQHYQPSPQLHQPPQLRQEHPSRGSDFSVRAGPTWYAERDVDYLTRIRPPKDSSSSTSDDALHIVIDPPLDDVEHVSAAGENTPGSEGEKDVMETDEGAQSKYEPWLRVGQEQEVQMQERPPLLPQPPPRQYQTPPLPPQHYQPSPQLHQPPQLRQEHPSRGSDFSVRAGPTWYAERDVDYLTRIRPPKDSSSSTSDDALHIVIDPPLDDVEYVSAAGENTPGSEGEKDVMETDEGAHSKYEPWLRVGQEQEVQMQERPPLLPQPPPRQYQTPPLPPQHYQPSPQLHQPPQLRQEHPSRGSDFSVRAGPTWYAESDEDYLTGIRPPTRTPGWHDLGGDLPVARELAQLTPCRDSRYAHRYEHQRSSRLAPYDPGFRGTTGMATQRSSRVPRHENELESQPPLLTHPAHHDIQEYPAPERYYFVRHIFDTGVTRESSPQTFTFQLISQNTPISPPEVITTSSPPKLVPISAPRHTLHCSQYTPPSSGALFDVPSTSDEPQQPLDLSALPRDSPTLIPISQSSSATSFTQTITSTTNTAVYHPFDLLPRLNLITEESNRIELLTNSSNHLPNRPITHRARTPVDTLPEYNWTGDNLDHTEEVETTDWESWLEYQRSFGRNPARATSLPPTIVYVPPELSTRSTSAYPPRTTSS